MIVNIAVTLVIIIPKIIQLIIIIIITVNDLLGKCQVIKYSQKQEIKWSTLFNIK